MRPARLGPIVLATVALLTGTAEGATGGISAAFPVLTAHGNANGSVSASWTPPDDMSLFDTVNFLIDSTNGSCIRLDNGSCKIAPTNGTVLLPGSTRSYTDEHRYSAGQSVEVQVCYYFTARDHPPYCSNIVSVTIPAGSSGGSTGGGGQSGATGTGEMVRFSQTVTIRHADGSTERKTSIVLVDKDVVESYGSPVHVTYGNGKVVIDRGSKLQYTPTKTNHYAWTLRAGRAYFSWRGILKDPGMPQEQISTRYATVQAGGAGALVLQTSPTADVVGALTTSASVCLRRSTGPCRHLRPHQMIAVGPQGVDTQPRPYPTPKHPFWQ